MQSLLNKVVIITGASQGLGAAIAQVLSDAGAIIIGVDMKGDQIKNLSDKLHSEGKKSEGIILDVTKDADIDDTLQYVLSHYGKIDVLINNAGIDITKPIAELSIAEFDKVIQVNLRAPFVLSKKVFSIMEQHNGGYIINITSTAAKRAWANASAYHASKWGLLGMSHALHVEGREKNIKVSAVISGGMRTPFILERFPDTPLNVLQDPTNVANVVKFILLQPEETVIPEVMVIPLHETSWP